MRVLCAMSGGVDSSVAALLLREAGHQVIGAFMRLGSPPAGASEGRGRSCCSLSDARDAGVVAARLGIDLYVLDFAGEFRRIIDDFVEEYHRGRTPNPCARCNEWLKFGSLFEKARALDCDGVATGHYARIEPAPGGPRLLRGADPSRDQSYFLFSVARDALARTIFPVGGLRKTEVREIARNAGLPVAEKPDSQEICFVPDDYRDLLRASGPGRMRPGRFTDKDGNDLGSHSGHQDFTIGQRRGVGAHGSPRYVIAIDPAGNKVVLGSREELRSTCMTVSGVRWASMDPLPPGSAIRALVQIRHRHPPAPATVTAEGSAGDSEAGRARVEFDRPEEAVTPGQAAVFYDGEVLLGGGWIERVR